MTATRILLVEDEPVVAMDVEERLARMGYAPVGRAQSGDEAVAMSTALRPDVVLMDIRLVGAMDGIAAATEIHRRIDTPVVFLTAHCEDETLVRARQATPYGYLIKPIKDSDLRSTIEIALYRHGTDRELARLNRLMAVLGRLSRTVLTCHTRAELFQAACHLLVEHGGIELAWIGWRDAAASRLVPLASAAQTAEAATYLRDDLGAIDLHLDGEGNPARSLREGRSFVCNECAATTCAYPADRKPAMFGFASCGSFPITMRGETVGVISVTDRRPGLFRGPEIALMEEMALNISFALDKIAADAQQAQLLEDITKARDQREAIMHAVQESEERLQSLVASMVDLVFVLDGQMRFTEVHQPREATPLLPYDQFLGHRFDEIAFPEPARSVILEALRKTLRTGQTSSAEYQLEMPEGRMWFSLAVSARHDRVGAPVGLTCVARDVTQRRHLDAIVAARAHLLELESTQSTDVVLRAVLDTAEELTGSQIGFYHFVLPDQITLTLQTWSTRTLSHMCHAAGETRHYPVNEAGVWVDCVRTLGPVIHNDYAALPHKHGLPQGHAPVVRELVVPVMRDGKVVAVVGIGNKPTNYVAGDVDVLSTLSDLSWDIVERMRLLEEQRQFNVRLEQRVKERTELLSREVVERRAAEARLRDKNAVFDASLAANFITDTSGVVIEANDALVRTWGYPSKDAVIGRAFTEFLADATEAVTIGSALESRGQWQGEYLGRRLDGSHFFAHSLATSLRDEHGTLIGFQGAVLDITERKAAEQALAATIEQLRETSNVNRELALQAQGASINKSRFIANMSHELRTPLNAIIGFAQLMQHDAELSAAQRRRVEAINRGGEQLMELIQDILDLSKIEAGTLDLKPAMFDLSALLGDVADSFRGRAEAKGLAFAYAGVGAPLNVVADQHKLRQILANLLGNAVKFTEAGRVALGAELLPFDASGRAHLVLSIADTGPGIAVEERAFLFRPFEQGASGRQREQGTGLGLAICRQLARLMGGDVSVDSTIGVGSVFRVDVPVVRPDEKLLAVAMLAHATLWVESGQPRLRALVVDDADSARRPMVEMLESAGIDVFEAESGHGMLAVIGLVNPDVVLVDLRMPGMTGDEAIRRVRALPDGARFKIITVTASATQEARRQCLDAGADDFVTKPFSHAQLLARIGNLTGLRLVARGQGNDSTDTLGEGVASPTEEEIAVLPTSLRTQLAEAAVRGRQHQLFALLDSASNLDPPVRRALQALVAAFDYETLLQLVQPASPRHEELRS